MPALVCVASLLPATALAEGAPYTLEEIGAMAPGQRSFTHSPLLELTGLPAGIGAIAPEEPGARGGGFEVLDVGDISLVAGPWTYASLDGNDITNSLNAFLTTHENEYDFVSVFLNEHIDFGAYYSPLQNDIEGLGAPPGTPEIFDVTTDWGFGELEGYLFMNSIFDYLGSVRDTLFFGQEVGHRWGAYVRRSGGGRDMLGRSDAHWSFFLESQNSTMEGNAWTEVEPGVFETDHMAEVGYSELDLYLMGLRSADDVQDWFLIDEPQVLSNPVGWPTEPSSPPYYAVRASVTEEQAADLPPIRVAGERIDISLQDVIDVHGPRDPGVQDSQRSFRMGFVVMMPASAPITFDEYLVAEDIAEELTTLWGTLAQGEASLDRTLGTSPRYEFAPEAFPDGPAYEPTFDSGSDTGLSGSGCEASVSPGGGAPSAAGAWLLLWALCGVRRTRRATSSSP